ncbi:MAG: arginine--tRNA ligase [Candidatus Omnitrophica bacterium]|nr:arginine--tRNA ligase [Candidatus Omnitrophota bacterium]
MKESIESVIMNHLKEYAKAKGVDLPGDLAVDLVVTKDPSHGDFSTNIFFKLAKAMKEKPSAIAVEIAGLIQKDKEAKKAGILKCEVAGPGFMNIYLEKESLGKALQEVRKQDEKYGESDSGQKKKVLIEFVSANPTGPLTIAHGRQAAVGDSIARILKAAGYDVVKEFYLNDAGRQITLLGESLYARYLQHFEHEAEVPPEGYQGEYLLELAKKLAGEQGDQLLAQKKDKSVDLCREYAVKHLLGLIQTDLKKIDVEFDDYFQESTLYKKGSVQEAIDYLNQNKHLYEEDGALWFKSSKFGDDKDRVVKKSTGEWTYLAPDIAYHRYKFQRGFQWLINLWGPDHHGYVSRLKAACQALGHDAKEVAICIVQLTTLYRKGQPVRMSTRAGEFVTLRELVDEVGADAARFFFIMRKVSSHLDFDLDLAKQKSQENPVYYLQYAHARIASLLKYAERTVPKTANFDLLDSKEERELIKRIVDYPKAIARAGEALEPYRVVDYLHELATEFHKFYSFHRVVTENEELTGARLILVEATRIVLRNGLAMLGISRPETM